MRPDALRPLCFLRCSTSWRCGALLVTPSKLLTDMNLRPGLVGLYFFVGISYTPSKRPSIFWPAPRVTIAFFQSGLWPSTRVCPRERRRFLPRTLIVLTSMTVIFWSANASSSARRIWIFVADGWQRNTYRPDAIDAYDFSLMTGRTRPCSKARPALMRTPPRWARWRPGGP